MHLAAWLVRRMREIDPAGAYARYAAYVTAVVGIAAACGFALATTVADFGDAKFAGVFAGLITGICLMTAQPGTTRRPIDRIATIGMAVALGAGLSATSAPYPVVAQPLTVVVAFLGFYARRWPEPWPSAGFLCALAFLINQIIAPYAPADAMLCAIPGAALGIALGLWFMPRAAFTYGLIVTARRLRAAIPGLLRGRLDTPAETRATVSEVNALLRQVNGAREQADRFNGAQADHHLALVHTAATVARVWENAAESLHEVADLSTHDAAEIAVAASKRAVAATLQHPSPESHGAAVTALDTLDRAIAETIGARVGSGAPDTRDRAPFALLNVELTLSHLIESVGELDNTLAAWPGGRP
jgi:hypothetical protein